MTCFEGDHITVFVFACFFSALYAFGIPVAVGLVTALKTPVVCRGTPDGVRAVADALRFPKVVCVLCSFHTHIAFNF